MGTKERLQKLEEAATAGDDSPPWFLELTGGITRAEMDQQDWNNLVDQFFPDEVPS